MKRIKLRPILREQGSLIFHKKIPNINVGEEFIAISKESKANGSGILGRLAL